jgi:photosystem II stability/assembly factor-like uncharacterized protein
MSTHIVIGTRKGLFTARRDTARRDTAGPADAGPADAGRGGDGGWVVNGPAFVMQEIAAVGVLPAGPVGPGAPPRLLAGVRSEHWGPTVARSDDLGRTWEETDQGAIRFPDGTGAALARVWQLQPDPARPGVVWAGCEPTSLWHSTDGGVTFALNRGLWDHPHRQHWAPGFGGAAVHTVVTDAEDPAALLVAMSTGGVYVSSDAGESWRPSNRGIRAPFLPDPYPEYGQCVHKVAVDAVGRSRLYAQNHHGVYRSDDGGGSWTSIADGLPSDFGFVVLAHPRRSGTAWVVPLEADARRVPPGGRLRVHRTRDAGSTWAESSAGLPDAAWTVVLRDAACVVDRGPDVAPVLAVGTRDGCVYVSDDEGDTFALLVDHLPDVLAVRGVETA